jgi:4-amino-4-deoxy-L-arabinose transferase-like glycosyltransferase
MERSKRVSAFLASDFGILILIALVRVILQILTNGTYGFHQDEMVTMGIASRGLAWGYVAWPPFTPFLSRVLLALFGLSPIGLRSFAVIAEGAVMVLAGLMVRDIGGSRWAQVLTAIAVGTTPISIIQGGLFQYETFDYFFWVLLAFMVVRLLKTEDPRWWLGIGAAIGLGMMNKYTIAFFMVGLVAGVLATRNRRYLASRWLWLGAILAVVIWLPNVIWELQNHWVSLDFLASIHNRDVQSGETGSFLINQLEVNLNPVMMLLVIGGLFYNFSAPDGRRYRMLGWMFVVPFVLFLLVQGKGYYVAGVYPMLAAGGAVWWEQRLAHLASRRWARNWRRITWVVLSAFAILFIAIELPVAPLGSAWWQVVSGINANLLSEVGWPQVAQQVAQVYDSLPQSEKAQAAILPASSGEIGAIDLYGPAFGLPRVIGGFNSYWAYGYGNPPPQTVIVVGFSSSLLAQFQRCTFATPIAVPFNVPNEVEVNHDSISICHNLIPPWPDFWAKFQYFG